MKSKNKLFVCATLTLLFCWFLVSSASATDDNTTRDPTPDTPSTSDNPVLIATEDNATTSDVDTATYQARDNSSNTTIDPPTVNDASESDDGLLISTQSSPDYTGYLVAGLALVTVIALSSFVIMYMKRKK